jgi:hypothetical protein
VLGGYVPEVPATWEAIGRRIMIQAGQCKKLNTLTLKKKITKAKNIWGCDSSNRVLV